MPTNKTRNTSSDKRCALNIKTIALSSLLLFFTSASLAGTLIVGVAPSLPKPVAEPEELQQQIVKKKSKFAAKQRKFDKQNITSQASSQELPTKQQAWQNVLAFISDEANLSLQYEHASSQLDFELKLAKGYYDLAYITPMQLHTFRDFPGYQAQVKRKAQPIRGMIFAKKNGPITTLTQLRDSTLAFPGQLDFPGSIVPRESLSKLNFGIKPKFVASADKVYEGIANGEFIAGGGTDESFRAQAPEIRNRIRMIWDSPGFSPYPLVAHPRVDFFSLTRLKKAFVKMIKDDEGRRLLKFIFVNNGFEVAKNSDWDEVGQIDLQKLNGNSKK